MIHYPTRDLSRYKRFCAAIVALGAIAASCAGAAKGDELPKSKPRAPGTAQVRPEPPLPSEREGAANQADLSRFESFWQVFRAAVERDDRAQLADLTKFPLEVRGDDDDDPLRRIQRKAFMKMLDKLLRSDPGLLMDGKETQKQHILRTTTLSSRQYAGDDTARVGNFEFTRVKGRWWLTRAYLGSEEG